MNDINKLIETAIESDKSPEDEEILELSQSSQQAEKKKNEERLIWGLCVLILLDICLLKDCQTWTFPLIIGVLQWMLVLLLGQTLKVEFFTLLTEKILDSLKRNPS